MKLIQNALLLTSLSLLSSSFSVAQTRFCIGGSLDQLSPTQRASCNAKLTQVREVAAKLDMPQDWHLIVVCDAQGWKDYLDYAALAGDALLTSESGTSVRRKEIFLRGDGNSFLSPAVTSALLSQVQQRTLEPVQLLAQEKEVAAKRSRSAGGF